MKKALIILFAVSLIASPVFAGVTSMSGESIGGATFTASTNVTVYAQASVSAYGAASGHLNGDKLYTTDSSSASINAADKTKGTAIADTDCPDIPGASS